MNQQLFFYCLMKNKVVVTWTQTPLTVTFTASSSKFASTFDNGATVNYTSTGASWLKMQTSTQGRYFWDLVSDITIYIGGTNG